MQVITTRFAPSPTGRLHLGHGWSAILAHDRAHDRARAAGKGAGGRFLLRIEDIDGGRCRPEHEAAILDDLAWLGLEWDGFSRQSERLPLYADGLERVRAMGLAYPCFCTRAEIAAASSAPHGAVAPYPGTCRGIDAGARMHEPHAWRLDMAAAIGRTGPLHWDDEAAGRVAADPGPQGDVVLARKDAGTSYHLAATLDDAAQGVTDVVRGTDLFEATHVHRLLQALLGLPTPRYHHHALVVDEGGERLAKRRNSPSLAEMRARGMDGRKLARDLRSGRFPAGFRLANP